jgi:hypothetical protein
VLTLLFAFYVIENCQAMTVSEQLDALRLEAARSIAPGWKVQTLKFWSPKAHKPRIQHLKRAAEERCPGLHPMRNAQEYVDFLAKTKAIDGDTTLTTVSFSSSGELFTLMFFVIFVFLHGQVVIIATDLFYDWHVKNNSTVHC